MSGTIVVLGSEEPKKLSTKEMLSYDEKTGIYKINYSSLSITQSCMQKAFYSLEKGYRLDGESDATELGKAIHRGLEYWYCLPLDQRTLSDKHQALAKTFGFNPPVEEPYDEGALEALRQFQLASQGLMALSEGDKRHPANGLKILLAYFKHYAGDRLEVVRDAEGPMIERKCSFMLTPKIEYFGTIDTVLRDIDTGEVFIADHKTTAQLGANFFNRLKPNHQYTGYVLAARKSLNLSTNKFLVNGIQVAKTKTEFARQITERDEEDFRELEEAVVETINRYQVAKETGIWTKTSPAPCAEYGGCTYLDICSSPAKLRQGIIDYKYGSLEK